MASRMPSRVTGRRAWSPASPQHAAYIAVIAESLRCLGPGKAKVPGSMLTATTVSGKFHFVSHVFDTSREHQWKQPPVRSLRRSRLPKCFAFEGGTQSLGASLDLASEFSILWERSLKLGGRRPPPGRECGSSAPPPRFVGRWW